jgi:hypothetical protein
LIRTAVAAAAASERLSVIRQEKRMKRRLFNIASATSLLLFVLAAVFWARSYWSTDRVKSEGDRGICWAWNAPGRLAVAVLAADRSGAPSNSFGPAYQHENIPGWAGNPFMLMSREAGDRDVIWQHAGFAWYQRCEAAGPITVVAVMPFWCIAAMTAALPVVWETRRLRRFSRLKQRGFDVVARLALTFRSARTAFGLLPVIERGLARAG